jgi:RNA polymerase sigma factor (sigma-70 family)
MKVLAEPLVFFGVGAAVRAPDPPLLPLLGERAAPRVQRPAPPPDEASLCQAALAGSAEAWSALVQRHNHRVVVSLLARGVRVDRAKDIAQEAWMRLVEQQRGGRLDRLQLPGLAIAQASFLALEAQRRDAGARKHDPIDEPAVAAALRDPQCDAEARLLTAERVARAIEVLSACSPSARSVFRLAYGGEGLSHAEVARRVGLSLQRVRQILCEVRAKLRDALLQDDMDDEARESKSAEERMHR